MTIDNADEMKLKNDSAPPLPVAAASGPGEGALALTASSGQGDPRVRAAFRAVRDVCAAAVSVGDRLDDREPEARASARTRAVAPTEALKRGRQERRSKTVALVDDVQLQPVIGKPGVHVDRALAVAERVLDQVR